MALGEVLKAAHDIHAGRGRDGNFRPWLKASLGMNAMSAHRAIAAWERFWKCNTVLRFQPTALYALSAPSCPPECADEAIRRAEAGEQITAKVAREIRESHDEQVVSERLAHHSDVGRQNGFLRKVPTEGRVNPKARL